jgi:hypothetical protein
MNIFLLRASVNRQDYVHLRLKATWKEIKDRLESLRSSINPKVATAVTEENLDGIRAAFDQSNAFYYFHHPGRDPGFSKVNYLKKDVQYDRLKKLADANAIEAHLGNLREPAFNTYLIDKIGDRLSVIDFSNAWQKGYLGKTKTLEIVKGLAKKNPSAIFLYTDYVRRFTDFKYGAVRLKDWNLLRQYLQYVGATLPIKFASPAPIDESLPSKCGRALKGAT